jgi:murein DD-endopeptidase MepM/ murein hydrolase activator NlpD
MRLTDHHCRGPLLLAVAAILVLAPPGAVGALPCWRPPVDAPVTDPYREPACRWCPGNRGIEYGTSPGVTVRAVATGRVSYAGVIAGRGYVVVRHADGLRATYGGLRHTRSAPGDIVIRGAIVGTTAGPLHFGLRDGDRYVDPTPFLGRLVGRVRLVPVDRTPPRSVPPVLRCRP